MRIDFVQGIIAYPFSGSQQTFLVKTGAYVSLQAQNSRVDVAFAHGNANYLLTETQNLSNVWGPIPASTECWLYWDIDTNTAVRTFGFTTVEPVYGSTVPPSPSEGLHWFDTDNQIMYAYESGAFRERIRCFAGKVINSTFSGLGVGFPLTPFAGSQVGIYTANTLVGRIVIDDDGLPIRRQTGEFFTTEDQFFVAGTSVTALKLEASVMTGTANETMAKYQVVKYAQFGRLNLAEYDDVQEEAIAILLEDLVWDQTGTVCIQGVITNPAWNWPTVGVPLYVTTAGQLSETDPHAVDSLNFPISRPPVGRVLSPTQIYFDQGLGGKGDKGEPGDASNIYASPTVAGVTRLSSPAADPGIPIAVGTNDPRVVNAVLRTGDTMSGFLTLNADPTSDLHAATKQYVDNAQAVRAPVDWADWPGINQPSTGTISLAGAPFNGASNVEVGQSVLTVYPNTEDDVGIWVIDTINVGLNTATVSRRDDALVGSTIPHGELIFAGKQESLYICSYNTTDETFDAPSVTIGATGHFAYFENIREFQTYRGPTLARQGVAQAFTFSNASNPTSRGRFHYIDASSGALTYTLPATANTFQDEAGAYASFRTTFHRIDSTNNIVTIQPPSGQYLNGVLNGTVRLPPNGSITFMNAQPDLWFITEGYGVRQTVHPFTLTDATTVTIDGSQSNNFEIVLNVAGTTRTFANPTNLLPGQVINLRIQQDGAGGRAVTFGTMWKWAGGITPTFSIAPNAIDFISAYYDSTNNILIGSAVLGVA